MYPYIHKALVFSITNSVGEQMTLVCDAARDLITEVYHFPF